MKHKTMNEISVGERMIIYEHYISDKYKVKDICNQFNISAYTLKKIIKFVKIIIDTKPLQIILEKYGIEDLEQLDDILKVHKFLQEHNYSTLPREDFDDLFQALKEKTKTIEIIKEKNVNVGDFKRCKSLEYYNDYCCYNEKEQLTKKEYDLLKEALL